MKNRLMRCLSILALAAIPAAAMAQSPSLTLFTDIANGYPPSVYTVSSFGVNWKGVVTFKSTQLAPQTQQDTTAAFLYLAPNTATQTPATNAITLTAPNGQTYTFTNATALSESNYPANILTFVAGGNTYVTNLVWQYSR